MTLRNTDDINLPNTFISFDPKNLTHSDILFIIIKNITLNVSRTSQFIINTLNSWINTINLILWKFYYKMYIGTCLCCFIWNITIMNICTVFGHISSIDISQFTSCFTMVIFCEYTLFYWIIYFWNLVGINPN